jgi:hypothetical protein
MKPKRTLASPGIQKPFTLRGSRARPKMAMVVLRMKVRRSLAMVSMGCW